MPKNTHKRTSRSFLIPSDLAERIEAMAERNHRRPSQIVRETLDWYIELWEHGEERGRRILEATMVAALNGAPLDNAGLRVPEANDCIDLNLWRQSHPRPIAKGGHE